VSESEASDSFACFGGTAAVIVGGGPEPGEAVGLARRRMLEAHLRLSRFLPASELSRLNEDRREIVPASPLMRRFVTAARDAGERSGGLVDPTLIGPIERAGYRSSMKDGAGSIPLRDALSSAPGRQPATARLDRDWRLFEVDEEAGTVSRPPGLRLDSGGVAKGLVADLLASGLRDRPGFVVDCCGDLRIGGSAGATRSVLVEGPFGEGTIEELQLADGAVATSGIGRRAWRNPDGSPGHHLLDPGTGLPAFTGLVQVTALAPSARLAEVLAKTALLSGPGRAASELAFGGIIVADDGEVERLPARVGLPAATPARAA
jgi:thiamine biosynthesis lipoprotein